MARHIATSLIDRFVNVFSMTVVSVINITISRVLAARLSAMTHGIPVSGRYDRFSDQCRWSTSAVLAQRHFICRYFRTGIWTFTTRLCCQTGCAS